MIPRDFQLDMQISLIKVISDIKNCWLQTRTEDNVHAVGSAAEMY